MYISIVMVGGRGREGEEREKGRERGGAVKEGERIENKPLYRQGKVSSSYHINLRVLSADPLEMTVHTKKSVMNLPLKIYLPL